MPTEAPPFMYRMLYYPLVLPPRPVLWQSLLYRDGLSSLIPDDYEVPADLRVVADLWKPTKVDQVLTGESLESFLADASYALATATDDDLRPSRQPLNGRNRLYYGKLPYVLEHEMEQRGVLERLPEAYRAPERLLFTMITLCAKYIAASERSSRERVVTHTDRRDAHQLGYGVKDAADDEASACWVADVGRLLPIPDPQTPVADVLRFREEYEDERDELIRAVRRLLASLRDEITSPADVDREVTHDLKHAVKRYAAARKKSRRAWIFTAASALVGVGAGFAAELPATQDVLAALLTPLSAIGVNLATGTFRAAADSDMTYLYELGRRFPEARA